VVLGQTLELLEKVDPRLPATFYCLFAAALHRWVRVYDYHDAQERVAMLREWIEGEPDADSATTERTPPGPQSRARVARKWTKRMTRSRISAS